VAAFASSLAPGEGWDLLLGMLDDPDLEARTAARRALVGFSREYASGRRNFPATGKIRPYLQALLRALQSPHAGDLEALTAALVHAGGHSSEARAALRSVIADEGHPAREAVLDSLRGGNDAAAARVLLTLLSSGSRVLLDLAVSIIRERREPAFLLALARAASREMESHGGISAAALARLEHAAWDSLRSEDVLSLPAPARACLLSILRKLRGRTRPRPDRSARVSEYVFPTAAPYLPAGAARTP
jgi:hypothetical protein